MLKHVNFDLFNYSLTAIGHEHAFSVTTNWNTNGHLMFQGSITYIKQGNDVYDISYYLSL